MPADLVRVDLDYCYDAFTERGLRVLAACRARGQDYFVTRGWASVDAQNQLYAQGRTLPGKVVTNARGGESAHNYGIAWDLTADVDMARGLQPSWDPKRYAILGEECEREGLVWGGRFKNVDMPHIQWPGFVSGPQLRQLLAIWNECPPHADERQRLSAVHQYLDALRGDV